MSIPDNELVAAAINCPYWWITKYGTVLIGNQSVFLWVGDGRKGIKFGTGTPPIYRKEHIDEIEISSADKNRLWEAYSRIKEIQAQSVRAKALVSLEGKPCCENTRSPSF